MVFIGSEDEYSRCSRISQHSVGSVLNLCGLIEPRISAIIIRKAKMFIGHDSGPMHLAAAVGTPVIAIFSARNKPGEWFPNGDIHKVLYHKTECFGCNLEVCDVENNKCIRSITVLEVMNEISSLDEVLLKKISCN